ncbi:MULTISPECIES: hypothetical protein [Paraburkholderia]|uniref:DNA primase n=1 Tax=Paraburkholderia madseniana TaxID=2599607 RepID=A0AAP5BD66_9BURK|nr:MULTISPECIES: hypothetical protein [Paraburkholderia]MCX4146755.1 hypothetical protein [Paraburkholderia madseniana]MDN7149701.1 hypothetical protein [Paraburkholderia sp. WS6]MDQ6408581.1 hypothetical protein [Paraburkholderia madseniana]
MSHHLSPLSLLLDRLEGVRAIGHNRWVARCPAHDDSHPSLAITEKANGSVLLHCFAGCEVGDLVGALSLDLSDLFPARQSGVHGVKPVKRRFSAEQVLQAVALELIEVTLIVGAIARRGSVTRTERERLLQSVSRFMAAEGSTHD